MASRDFSAGVALFSATLVFVSGFRIALAATPQHPDTLTLALAFLSGLAAVGMAVFLMRVFR